MRKKVLSTGHPHMCQPDTAQSAQPVALEPPPLRRLLARQQLLACHVASRRPQHRPSSGNLLDYDSRRA
eukprot:7377747-Prymnesium_polylepis.1